MLLKRYSNIDFVMNLDVEDGVALIAKAFEKQQEDLLIQRWILHYQGEMTFEEFKGKLKAVPASTFVDTRTEGEILDEVKDILGMFRG